MDPISTIVAALVAGTVEAAKPTAVQAVKDAYGGLKALIVRKFSGATTPLQSVEEKPASESRQSALKEELADTGIDRDAEIARALQQLVATLQQHAPQSVTHFAATVDGINVQGSNFHETANIVGRDQVINNITVGSVDRGIDLAAVLRSAINQLAPDSDMMDRLAIVLDEISKLYQMIDSELTRYLSLSFDDPQQAAADRAVLLSLDGGLIQARAAEARGHCEKISHLYFKRLRPWLQDQLAAGTFDRIERAFSALAVSDANMAYVTDILAQWLSKKASLTLDMIDAGDTAGALRNIKNARLDCQEMRQKLARTISTMRDIQTELLRLSLDRVGLN